MPVTSTTLAGVNVWQLSGAVTDAELKTAWAGLIVNNRYLLARAIYIDNTCSLVNVRGTYYIDAQNLGVILHLSRNKANTLFRNWFLTQTVGLSVGSRSNFVRFTNGTTITNSLTDGIDMQGGGMMYGVVGNPGGGDPRFLNEMMFGSLDGTLVTSAAWTEQEIEPNSIGTIWRGMNIQKAAGYPILPATGGLQRQVIYRSNFNTESATLRLIRPYNNNSVCYVSTTIRRQGAVVTSNLGDTFASSGAAVIMALNNWQDETWFGVSKSSFTFSNWSAGNRVIGGVMKKILVQPSTVIRTYDSRSTATSQKSTFSETTNDFLTGDGTTNLLLHSEALDNAAWVKGDTTIGVNATTAPDGTMTADRVIENTATAQHRVNNTTGIGVIPGVAHTYSFYAKADQRSFVHARIITANTNAQACFDLTNGTSIQSAGTTATITPEGDGWFRCSISGVTDGGSAICYANIALSSSLTVPNYAGSTSSGLFLWGHQFQQGATATQYLPTTTSRADGYYATASDAVTGRAQIVCVGAIATGGGQTIARFTGQRFTLQKFGFRVQVETPDMTFGDDDLSAFSPITMAAQNGLVRTQVAIAAATSIESYRELLEELHALAIGLSGSASYNAPFGGNLFELSGNTLTTAFASVLVDKTAAQKISYNATTGALVIRSTTLASGLTVSQWSNTTGPISTANGATITGVYADSNGQRVRVFGLDPEGFGVTWYLRHRVKGTSTWTNLSGTGDQTLVILAVGEYEFQARVPGYDWEETEIDTAVSLSLDMALRFQVSANNTPQWEMPFSEALSNAFQFDPAAEKVAVTNETGAIIQPGFAELYRATQRIQHIPALVWTWVSPVTANATSQKILIPAGNPIEMFLTDDSDASVKITCPVIYADTGESADDRVRGNPDGFSIILGSPATAESAGLQAGIVAALGGANYTEAEASQVVLRGLIDELQTLVGQVKARSDLIPDEPATAAAVEAIGTPLQAADYTAPDNATIGAIATKVATLENTDLTGIATSAEVGALSEQVGTPLQAGDYVAPANDDIASIKTTVEAIEPPDLSGLATAEQVGDLAEAVGTPLQASAYTAPPAAATVATAVRTELATELGRLDAAVSTRLATTGYTAPDNTTIGQIKTKVDTLENADVSGLPTLADIEGSTVLAKADGVAAVGAAVEALGTPLQAEDYQAPPTTEELLESGLAKETTAQAALEAAEFAGNVSA